MIPNWLPAYICELIPKTPHRYINKNFKNVATYQCRTDAFKFSFIPWIIIEGNKTDIKIQNSLDSVFRNYLLKEISPLYNICNLPEIKLLARWRLELSHLKEQTFNHNFCGVINPFLSLHQTSFSIAVIIIPYDQYYLRIWTQ